MNNAIPIKLIIIPGFNPLGVYLNSISCFPVSNSIPISVSKISFGSILFPSTFISNPLSYGIDV